VFDHITRKRKVNERRAFGAAALSVAVHLGIVLLLVLGIRSGRPLFADEGTPTGVSDDDRAGGGGGGGGGGEVVSYYELPPPPPPPPAPVPVPEEVLIPPVPVPPPPPPVETPKTEPPRQAAPAPQPAPQPTATPGTGGGTGAAEGSGQGPGQGPGTGPGSGGGSGGGTGGGVGSGSGPGTGLGRGTNATWDFLIIPPARPRGMPSRDIEIRVLVDERGQVKEVELNPSTGNRGYDEQLRRMARAWRFNPARDPANRPVEQWVPVVVTI
jgi:protein TonB